MLRVRAERALGGAIKTADARDEEARRRRARVSASIRVRATVCLAVSLASTFEPRTDRASHCRPRSLPLVAPAPQRDEAAAFICLAAPDE